MFSVQNTNPNRQLFRGIVSMLIGIAVLIVPDLTLITVMRALGVLLLADGAVAFLIRFFRKKDENQNIYSLMPRGTLSIIMGTILVLFPTLLVNVFVFVFGLILVLAGFSQLLNQLGGRGKLGFSLFLTLIALISLVTGIVLLTKPFESAQVILMIFGAVIAIYGIGEVVWSFKIRKFQKMQPKKQPDIIDAEYEEVE